MKTINKSTIVSLSLILGLLACGEPDLPSANLNAPVGVYKANFTFANATLDAPTLSFFVNGNNLGSAAPSVALPLYSTIALTSPGVAGANPVTTGSLTANTAIRAKAPAGTTIGGLLGGSDLLYRSANNGTNNFAALNNTSYTVIAMDSISRPRPVRLNRFTSTISFADVTYWNPNTKMMISASRRDSLNPANCKTLACPTCTGCVNYDDGLQGQSTSTAVEFANLVTVGLVPLGLTDPGGIRFLVLTDAPTVFTAGTVVTNAGIRFVNAIVNSNGITAAANANGTFGGPAVHARLRPTAGACPTGCISLAAGTGNAVSVSGGFSPTAGSRTFGNLAFGSQAIAVAGVPNAYTLEVASDAGFTTMLYSAAVSFPAGRSYTIFVRGMVGGTGSKAISHGIIVH